MQRNKGFSALNYAILVAIAVATLVGLSIYFKRGLSARYRQAADSFGWGRQYDTRNRTQPTCTPDPECASDNAFACRWDEYKCKCCCRMKCFVKDTQITLADGSTKPIKKIKVGELVLGYKDNQVQPGKVIKTIFHPKEKAYLLITTEDNRKLKTTPEHLIFTGKRYEPARALKPGSFLFVFKDNKLKPVKVKSVERKKEKVDLYNIEVENLHNFFAEGILCHNAKCLDRDPDGRCTQVGYPGPVQCH